MDGVERMVERSHQGDVSVTDQANIREAVRSTIATGKALKEVERVTGELAEGMDVIENENINY